MSVDLSGAIESLAAVNAMNRLIQSKTYQEYLMEYAHGKAENEFNRLAAAAAATGQFRHMYEWGTRGINKGKSNVRPDPMSERARLWNHKMVGRGLNQRFEFSFKPSLATVPKPTTTDTGMSQEDISQLKDHVFMWKAMVMETGATVVIKPKRGKILLMPFYGGKYPAGAKARDKARGYSVTRNEVTFKPGAKVVGNFTAFWKGFWENQGQAIFINTFDADIRETYAKGQAEANSSRGKAVPPIESVVAAVNSRAAILEKQNLARARGKAAGRNVDN